MRVTKEGHIIPHDELLPPQPLSYSENPTLTFPYLECILKVEVIYKPAYGKMKEA